MPDASLLFDSHMHTPLCKHAVGHPSEYVAAGLAAGLDGIIFTCHSPMPDRWSHAVRMSPDQFDAYVALVDEGRSSAPAGFEVRLGLESDFFPGMESWLRELHQRAPFHYILGSVHWHLPEYRDAYWRGDIDAFQRQYFDHLADSAETGLFDALAHPDLIKNADPSAWKSGRLEEVIARALDRIAATGVAMELNTSGTYKIYREMNPGPGMLSMMRERGIPVVLGSDSHLPSRVADLFLAALDLLETAGYTEIQVFANRRPQPLDIDSARHRLRRAVPLSVG
jgi:histidinol-phosphatase (PHP family)